MSEEGDAAVVVQWCGARDALAEVRRRELRQLSDADGLAAAEQLLDLVRHLPPKHSRSGLVEQQRLFARAPR
jgi:hypothetical protein